MTSHWHILGVGAIGGLFACRLKAGGASVTLLDHRDHGRHQAPADLTLTLTGDATGSHTFPWQPVTETRPIEHLLVCTKSWGVESAVASVAPRISQNSVVVLLCNGMGHDAVLAPYLGDAMLVLGSTTAGCRLTSSGERRVSGNGATYLGTPRAPHHSPDWTLAWQRGVPGFHWTEDIHSVLLAKVALNAVINPLTAVLRVTNGDRLSADYLHQTQQAIAEVQGLLIAGGASELAEALPDQVREVCLATAENHSSMRVDLDRAQRTEIESIVGWLLQHLCQRPPPTPLLSSLYKTISSADKQGRAISR
ncbi:MAG: 2-dehydropantoate 2-reductase [Luminiphilus sp.]